VPSSDPRRIFHFISFISFHFISIPPSCPCDHHMTSAAVFLLLEQLTSALRIF